MYSTRVCSLVISGVGGWGGGGNPPTHLPTPCLPPHPPTQLASSSTDTFKQRENQNKEKLTKVAAMNSRECLVFFLVSHSICHGKNLTKVRGRAMILNNVCFCSCMTDNPHPHHQRWCSGGAVPETCENNF